MNHNEARRTFFDGIAEKWDGWEDLGVVAQRLDAGLAALGIGGDQAVLDVGCGTGNLTQALLKRLGPKGRVVAVDLSPQMIERARAKNPDPRASFVLGDAAEVPLQGSFDHVVCCAVWPHFDDPVGTVKHVRRSLLPGGALHVWHWIGRERVNEIHSKAGEAVRHDVLAPARQTAAQLTQAGLRVVTEVDEADRYLVTALAPDA